MGYYQYHDCILYAAEPLPHQKLDRLPPTGEIVYPVSYTHLTLPTIYSV